MLVAVVTKMSPNGVMAKPAEEVSPVATVQRWDPDSRLRPTRGDFFAPRHSFVVFFLVKL